MARRAGEGNKTGLERIFTNGLMLELLFALGLMFLTLWFVPVLFSLSLSNYDNFSLCVNFIYIRVWGLPFLLMTQLMSAYFIATSNTRGLIWGSLTATCSNILLDYALIFGHFGFPAMGFNGAALASVCSEVVYFFTMALLLVGLRKGETTRVFSLIRFDFELAVQTLRVSTPLIVQFLFSIGGWMIFFIFVEHLDKQSLAASQILRNVFGIVGVGTWALATTANTLVSKTIGEGHQDKVLAVISRIALLSLAYTLVVSTVLLLFPTLYLSIYTSDPALIAFSLPSLQVLVFATLIMALSTVAFNGVVGTGNTLVNLTMEVSCVGIYLLYCYWFIYKLRSPLYLCWGSEFVYWFCLLVGSVFYLKSNRWRDKRI
jgi:putative MATE family efflux protein